MCLLFLIQCEVLGALRVGIGGFVVNCGKIVAYGSPKAATLFTNLELQERFSQAMK